jgi:hypothetical protein
VAGIIDNLVAIRDAVQMVRDNDSLDEINKTLDNAILEGDLPVEEKRLSKGGRHAKKSRLKYRTTAKDGMFLSNMYNIIRDVGHANDQAPKYGSSSRDDFLSCFWRSEPILAGAVYSMSAKMGALSWMITGKADEAKKHALMLSQAAHSFDGYDWGGFISATAEDFYTLDRGTWWETARDGNSMYGPIVALGHIDGLACWPTGNVKTPVWYQSVETNQSIKFKPGQYIHFASMPSPREQYYGIGFCAVSRALRAAKLLTGLRDYDEEKLANLPPEGVAAVSGLTMVEFKNALKLWQIERKNNKSLTFPQVLWLIGSQPQTQVNLEMIGFSQLPESFDRESVVSQYINTLALDFGVDVREFWPVSSSSLGTASESEIQHMKAKGKGPGEFISVLERSLNAEFPETIHFQFDTQDIGEDKIAAEVAKMWIEAYLPLTKAGAMMGSPGGAMASGSVTTPASRGNAAQQPQQPVGVGNGEGIISDDQFLRLLSDKGVLPDYIVEDDRVSIMDTEVYINKEWDSAQWVWKDGKLSAKMLPAINIPAPRHTAITAEIYEEKGGAGSGHFGHSGRLGLVGGSLSGPDKGGGEGGTAPKSKASEEDRKFMQGVSEDVLRAFGRDPNARYDVEIIDDLDDRNEFTVGIRHFGRWDNPPDARYEQDYDWQEMHSTSRAKFDGIVDAFSGKYQELEFIGSTGEKNWVYVDIKPKGSQETKEELERNIRGKPIPEGEVVRGAKVTETAIDAELELWRGIHRLAVHAPHEGEEEEIAEIAD